MNLKAAIVALLVPGQMLALNITIDYSEDDYFSNVDNPYGAIAQAALQAAADEISSLITNSLSPITTDVVSTTSGGAIAQITTTYNYVDPNTGSLAPSDLLQRSPVGIGADEVVIYVGARSMGVFTFAEASPGTPTLSIAGGGAESGWQSAVSGTEATMNQIFGRGGYDIQRINGSATLGSTPASYNLNFGPTIGSLWFNDSPGDVSSGRESWEVNNEFWHFDHTTEVGTGKIDVYSVALHEILHVLGYGTSASWDDLVSGTDWAGSEVASILGTGIDALNVDGFHIASGLESPGYEDGVLRQTVLNKSPQPGERDQITLLDIAFLEDVGYQIATIPEPSAALLLGLTLIPLSKRRR